MRPTVLLLAALSGCGYVSTYVAPADGRARPVYRDNDVVAEMSGAPASQACLDLVRYVWRVNAGYTVVTGAVEDRVPPLAVAAGVFWVPRFYGAPLVPGGPGVAPLILAPPLFSPRGLNGVASSGQSAGMFARGGGNDGGRTLMVLAVVALVVLPIVDIGVALDRPESSERSSKAIDEVNIYNDFARSPANACSYSP